jgi:serine/threonine-protein kinase
MARKETLPGADAGDAEPSAPSSRRLYGGRYAAESELGRGGMGHVFRARDLKLGREVAIKVLAPGRHDPRQRERLEQEARAAGSLNHPNILDVHDVGEHEGEPYIVTELLEGETLRTALSRGPLRATDAVRLGLQLADGLAAAHDHGIVHRDLKPENLFITKDGRLKILDFGIARLPTEAGRRLQTETGEVIGTASYMSPEQVRGRRADARSDLFAFGAVLQEMVTGAAPFERGTTLETAHAILEEPPAPVGAQVPAQLASVIARCLCKDPAERFQSARELARELDRSRSAEAAPSAWRKWSTLAALAAIAVGAAVVVAGRERAGSLDRSSIAVLPFANLSSDEENEYFSDGISEELINALSNVEGLRVVARTSAFAFKGKNLGIRQIGEELKVATVLEGSVRREGNRLRVAAQLIGVVDGYHLWSKTYDRELKSVFALEDELARAIVQALEPKLLQGVLVQQGTGSVEAHDLYLKGRYFWNKRTREGITKAQELFQQAIDLDPTYALAHSGLADSYTVFGSWGWARPPDIVGKAKDHARKALELDGALAEAHASLCLISDDFHQDFETGLRECERAIELRPAYASAHQWRSELLAHLGRLPEAAAEAQRAAQLDPASLIISQLVGVILYYGRDYDRAIEHFLTRTLELDPNFGGARGYLALAYSKSGRHAEALAELDKLDEDPIWVAWRAYVLASSGDRAAAQRLLAKIEERSKREYVQPTTLAAIQMALGNADLAFVWLANGIAELDPLVGELKVDPMWDPLRSDPRFTQLLKRLHLE